MDSKVLALVGNPVIVRIKSNARATNKSMYGILLLVDVGNCCWILDEELQCVDIIYNIETVEPDEYSESTPMSLEQVNNELNKMLISSYP